ncbi:MAG: lipopolysaccharide biosynthesis protein [Polyangiales bacterium]
MPHSGVHELPTERSVTHDSDLRRGALANLLGFAVRAGHPLLLALTTHLYGAGRWGLFVAAQAGVMLAVRVALLGFDKGLLYWLPQRDRAGARSGLAGIAAVAGSSALLLTLLAALAAGPLADSRGLPEARLPWSLMALGILPQAVGDFFAYASVARRRPEVLVLVREVVLPFSLVGAAIALHALGLEELGLAWAFLASQCLGAVAAGVAYWRCVGRFDEGDRQRELSSGFVRYALPLGAAETLNVLLFRLDALVLAALVDPALVGVYGVVTQFGNTVRGARASFEPVVHAVAADMATAPRGERVREGFGLASSLVFATQLPLAFAAVMLAPLVLPWFGPGFERGQTAVVIACVGWTLNGLLGLAGPVVSGFGGSRVTLLVGLATLGVLGALLGVLVPPYGVDGAALAVALAFVLQGLLQCAAMRALTGSWGLSEAMLPLLTRGATATAAALLTLALLEGEAPHPAARACATAVFALFFLPAALRVYRRPKPVDSRAIEVPA